LWARPKIGIRLHRSDWRNWNVKGQKHEIARGERHGDENERIQMQVEGSIAFVFADEEVSGSPFKCTFDERTDDYYILNTVP
jgi:hypothetical protein